ncbi:hypothetical protein ROE7235_00583 [Roseibaca ekhonensis]|uniref:DUF2125 domain-containing protein n=1 Tax=Roseinatronobacter ekhonensis TaxID=254356 RepID=A0A3B0MPM1_9RHOB|nr:DUF2125 domain-containing protein [Roseibaca ekhonensis]SUZ30854.1 hypothetical protein ROE7235_00583 [Roseibaca ekhonensis]
MRFVLGLIIIGAMFCAYWGGASYVLRHEHGRLAAKDVQVSDVAVTGFPLRFDLTAARPALPALGWSAAWLRATLPSYWPFRAEGVLSGTQTLMQRGTEWQVSGGDMPFSLNSDPALRLNAAQLRGDALRLTGPGATLAVDQFEMTLSPADIPSRRNLTLSLQDVTSSALPQPLRRATLDAMLEFDHAPDLRGTAQLATITLQDSFLEWDGARIGLDGTATLRDDRRLDGQITLTVTGWRTMLAQMQATGLIPPDQAPMVQMMAASMSNGDDLILPLAMDASVLSLGPLVLFDLGRF